MAQKSTIQQLPEDIKLELDKLIKDGRYTIDQLVEYLQDQGAPVSRSAVGRHKKKMDRALERLRQSGEVTKVLVKELGDKTEGEMSSAMREILRSMVFDFMMEGEKVEPKQFMFIAKTLKDIEQTAQISTKREREVREEMKQIARDQAQEAAKEVDKITKQAGLSGEFADEIRRQILGVGAE